AGDRVAAHAHAANDAPGREPFTVAPCVSVVVASSDYRTEGPLPTRSVGRARSSCSPEERAAPHGGNAIKLPWIAATAGRWVKPISVRSRMGTSAVGAKFFRETR